MREVAEEAGIAVRDVRYVGSQPWPFPSSLMLAFTAVADGDAVPVGRDGELEEVRWFHRDEVARLAGRGARGPGSRPRRRSRSPGT